MRRKLVGMWAAALLLGGAVPATAAWNAYNNFGGQFCTTNALVVCMDFNLEQNSADATQFLLTATWVSTQGGGAWTAFGLYMADTGQPGPNPTISNAQFVDGSGNPISITGWTVGANDNPAINGDGSVWFTVAADTNNGVNNAALVGTTMRISFSSTDLVNFPDIYARSHVQSFGDNGCSIKPDSRDTGDHLVGTAAEADAACGTTFDDGGGGTDSTVPEPFTMVLLGSGLLGLGGVKLRRRRPGSVDQD